MFQTLPKVIRSLDPSNENIGSDPKNDFVLKISFFFGLLFSNSLKKKLFDVKLSKVVSTLHPSKQIASVNTENIPRNTEATNIS